MNMKKKTSEETKLKKFKPGYGFFSICLIVIVIALFVFGNALATLAQNKYDLSADLTQYRVFTLSDATVNILSGISEPINIYTLYPSDQPDEEVATLLDKYRAQSPYINVENVDPELNPTFTTAFDPNNEGIEPYSVIVANADNTNFTVYPLSDLNVYMSTSDGGMSKIGSKAEQKITSAIQYLLTGEKKRAVFLTGHGETDPNSITQFLSYLDNLNYDLITYSYIGATEKLDSKTDTLFVIAPKKDLTQDEYDEIKKFFSEGGRGVFFMDNILTDNNGAISVLSERLNNFDSLLKLYDLEVNRDVVIGSNENAYYKQPLYLIGTMVPSVITDPIIAEGRTPIIPISSSLSTTVNTNEDVSVTPIVYSNKDCFIKNLEGKEINMEQSPDDVVGSALLSAISVAQDGSQIVLFGSSGIVGNSSAQLAGNADLIINCISYLNKDTQNIEIAPKRTLGESMQFTSNTQIYGIIILCLIIAPALLIAIGIVIWLRRSAR